MGGTQIHLSKTYDSTIILKSSNGMVGNLLAKFGNDR